MSNDDIRAGAKVRKLAELSKANLGDEEFDAAVNEIAKESDRGAAIMGGALIEQAMMEAILIANRGKVTPESLFFNQGAPFGSLHQKIVAIQALGFCDDKLAEAASGVRRIRNQFAHALRAFNFEEPTVLRECEKLAWLTERSEGARFIYVDACLEIWLRITRQTTQFLKEHGDLLEAKFKWEWAKKQRLPIDGLLSAMIARDLGVDGDGQA